MIRWIKRIENCNHLLNFVIMKTSLCRFIFISLLYVGMTSCSSYIESSNDLSSDGSANCYIVSREGTYKFSAVKGNSSETLGKVSSIEVLWESFGDDYAPEVGSLIKSVDFNNNYIAFQTAEVFKKGNAVIAAKGAKGKIIWSWHIWFTDHPQNQVYYNNAGIMMDRNLGATSAVPGDIHAHGLLYQWGRKDPFMGPTSITSKAASTIIWPTPVESTPSTGTIEYSIANPTTFIGYYNVNDFQQEIKDWCCEKGNSIVKNRWTESILSKSIYDPCPVGWRVPNGGLSPIWMTALGSIAQLKSCSYDYANHGMDFSTKLGDSYPIWYPAMGYRVSVSTDGDGLYDLCDYGEYWSASSFSESTSSCFYIDSNGNVNPVGIQSRIKPLYVRCIKE